MYPSIGSRDSFHQRDIATELDLSPISRFSSMSPLLNRFISTGPNEQLHESWLIVTSSFLCKCYAHKYMVTVTVLRGVTQLSITAYGLSSSILFCRPLQLLTCEQML
ncbi:hypothetical protein AHF37_11308 [Paragonimus kellicotti]|nr:hypothetical protein AHF37_11308 [Paragonimus kellicotti]